MRTSMPSPNGTNFEWLFLNGNRPGAMDEAPDMSDPDVLAASQTALNELVGKLSPEEKKILLDLLKGEDMPAGDDDKPDDKRDGDRAQDRAVRRLDADFRSGRVLFSEYNSRMNALRTAGGRLSSDARGTVIGGDIDYDKLFPNSRVGMKYA